MNAVLITFMFTMELYAVLYVTEYRQWVRT
jgi:hypothetical protein